MIYLAAPFFTKEQRKNVEELAAKLRSQGLEVFVPMEHTIPNAWELQNAKWGKAVFEMDVTHLCACSSVHAIVYGMQDDAGTSWEIGYAYAMNKPIYLHHANSTTYSLMIENSASDNKGLYLQS